MTRRGRFRRPARVALIAAVCLTAVPLGLGLQGSSAAPAPSLSGTVFSDTDGNGVQDTGDAGIPSLAITVTDSAGTAVTTTTGTGTAAGEWSVTGLPAGTYTVTVATPANSTLTTAQQPGGADPATVTLATGASAQPFATGFRGPDQPPVFASTANNTQQTVNPGAGLARLTASDPNNDLLTYTLTAGSLPDGISLQTDGTFTGTATNTTSRVLVYAPVTISVDDHHGASAETQLTVTVLPATDAPPQAVSDTGDTIPGKAVTIGVLTNDRDPNGDALTLTSFTQGSRGSGIDCTASGQCTFSPAASVLTGTETFDYVVSDGRGGSATGTVTVTIDNVKPVFTQAAVNTAQAVPVGTALSSVLATDANADPITYTLTSGAASLPQGVTFGSDGSFAGAPVSPGVYHLTIEADDNVAGGGAPGVTSLTVTVSNPPVVLDNKPVAVPDSYPAAGSPAIAPGVSVPLDVLTNDTDSDDDNAALRIIAYDTPTKGGTVSLAPDGRTLIYTPRAGFVATDTFTYTVSDGKPGGTDVGQVSVVVSPPADQPPAFTQAAANSQQTVPSGTALTALSASDPDTASGLLRYSVTSGLLPVGVSLGATTGAFAGTPVNAGTTDDTYTVTVSVSDGTLVNVTPQTLVIVVTPQPRVDRAPTPQPDAVSTPNGVSVTIDVLANDTDPDGDQLTISGFDPTSADGGTVSCTTAAGCTYTPASGTRGDDTFSYTVSDGLLTATATVTVTVGTAQAPVVTARDDTATTTSANPVAVNVTGNDTDSAGYALTASAATQPTHGAVTCSGGTCTYTPTPGFEGNDTFTYVVADTQGGSATATVAVAVVAAAIPTVVANPDAATGAAGAPIVVAVTANDVDSAGLALSVIPSSRPVHGTVSCLGGTCTYTPNAGFSGTDGFSYAVSDGFGGTALGSVVVTVLPPNVARDRLVTPVLVAGPVTVTLTVGVHPAIPLGGRLLKVVGKLPPGTTISRPGVFQGAATVAGKFVSTVTISYKGVPVNRKLVVTVKALSIAEQPAGNLPAQTTAPAPTGTPVLAFTGASGVETLLGTALGLLGLGAALFACGTRRGPRRRRA